MSSFVPSAITTEVAAPDVSHFPSHTLPTQATTLTNHIDNNKFKLNTETSTSSCSCTISTTDIDNNNCKPNIEITFKKLFRTPTKTNEGTTLSDAETKTHTGTGKPQSTKNKTTVKMKEYSCPYCSSMVNHGDLHSHIETDVTLVDVTVVVRLTKLYSADSGKKREIAKFECSLCKALTSSMSYHLKNEHQELSGADKRRRQAGKGKRCQWKLMSPC